MARPTPGTVKRLGQVLPVDFAEALRALSDERPRRNATLLAAHEAGWNYQTLADAIGISREAVRKAIFSASPRQDIPAVPPPPRWPARKARELAPCGTKAAYSRHVRRGEPVDEACRAAKCASHVGALPPRQAQGRCVVISAESRVRAALAAYAASVQPRPALSLIRDRTRKTAAPEAPGAAAKADQLGGNTAMTTIISRHARDLHAGDVIVHDPDHDRPVRWRVQRPPVRTRDGEYALADVTDLATGESHVTYYRVLQDLSVEPVGGAA